MPTNELTKRYYKIKDVAELIGVAQSTLRYWENEFSEISPRRSATNQRYFTPEDIQTLRIIKYLLKEKGLKIEAAKEELRSNKYNITKRFEVVEQLIAVRDDLERLLKALNLRGGNLGLEPEIS